jgi:hypothetical protein
MLTIHAYLAYTALGSLTFLALALRGRRAESRNRRVPAAPALARAA